MAITGNAVDLYMGLVALRNAKTDNIESFGSNLCNPERQKLVIEEELLTEVIKLTLDTLGKD